MTGKVSRKIIHQLHLMVYRLTTKRVNTAYISKHNSNHEIILLIVTKKEGWHYIAVTKLCALLREITSKHNGVFICLNCLHLYRTKNKLETHKKVC